jgi:hypothetical protein
MVGHRSSPQHYFSKMHQIWPIQVLEHRKLPESSLVCWTSLHASCTLLRPLRVATRLVRYHCISDPRLVYVSLKPVWIGFKHSLLRYFHRFTNAVRDGCPKHNFNSKHPLLLCISLQTYQRGSGNTRRPRDLFHGRHHGVTASPKASHQTAGSSGTQGAYVLFALLRAGPSSRGCNSNRTYVSLV